VSSANVDDAHHRARIELADEERRLSAVHDMHLGAAGLLWQRLTVRNDGSSPYTVHSVHLTFPVPEDAHEILDTAGRWSRERAPQRLPFTIGAHVRESRRGRPGSDSTLLLTAGRAGFGFERGRVHGVHLAWSGNHRLAAERGMDGWSIITAGELLEPGEIVLGPGDKYRSPWAVGSWGDGLSHLSERFHTEWRSRPEHPVRPRPVTLNTWEALGFDVDRERVWRLIDRAAELGVERFVLDDGWFRGRRHDRAGLGDWEVDTTIWPEGLHPLVDRISRAGMEFGLWIEPEMVNLDSVLARNHPDWMLRGRVALPPPARGQQALDLSRADARDYVSGRIASILREYPIAALKWDHNRDLVDAADGPGGASRARAQVWAVYELLDQVQESHPDLEIEASASGGARVDLGMLSRVDRIWASDELDPIERLSIQRYTGLVVPPEMIGAHVSLARSPGGPAAVALSSMVALLGHFGLELDLGALTDEELDALRQWIQIAKNTRALVATGRRIDVDHTDPGLDVRGVVAPDQRRAVFTMIQTASGPTAPPGRVRLPGLDQSLVYRVLPLGGTPVDGAGRTPLHWAERPTRLSGRELAVVGVRPPILPPRSGMAVELTAEDSL
jgi:alpha-galactosidase